MPLYFCLFGTGYLTASFSLAEDEGTPDHFGVSDKDVIVCSTGSSLLLFSMKGLHLQTFQYSPEMIVRLWVVCLDRFFSSGGLKIDLHFKKTLHCWGVHICICLCVSTFRVQRQTSWC